MALKEAVSDLEQAARHALMQVIDPEVGENIVDLGLVYGISGDGGRIRVNLTMTSQACPMGEMIVDEVFAALAKALPDSITAEVALVWEPPWNPAMISAAAKQRLGW